MQVLEHRLSRNANGMTAILALATDAYAGEGGIARYNRDWLGVWNGARVDLLLLTAADTRAEATPAHVRIVHAGKSRIGLVLAVLARLRGPRPDWVWCGHLHLAPVAALMAWWWRVPMWLQVHGIEAWPRPSRWRRLAAERAQLITAVSRHTRREVLRWWPGAPERVRVLPNTVSEVFAPLPQSSASASAPGPHAGPVLLTVGRLAAGERYKGHDRVLQLLPMLVGVHPDLIYVIAGDGDDRARLQELTVALGVAARVQFVGHVAADRLPDLYRSADLLLMPSTGEGFGIAFLEAMACGTPALGLIGDGSVDALQDGHLGHCVAASDLGPAILKALASRPSPADLSQRTLAAFGRPVFDRHCRSIANSLTASQK